MDLKVPLKQHYGHDQTLETFFKTFLNIPDCSLDDVIEELEYLDDFKEGPWEGIYGFLNDEVHTDLDWQRVR